MRSAQRHLAPLLVRQASTAVAKKGPEPAGLFGGLFGGSARITTPLDEALPDVVAPRADAPPAQAPALQTAALAPGLTLAAVPLPGPTAALTLVLDVGTSHEGPDALGACSLLRSMAFSATANRSTFRLTRELEKFGIQASATLDRETMSLSVVAPKTAVAEAAELLLDAATNARLANWEVGDMVYHAQEALAAHLAQPGTMLAELLHRAAYSGALAQPLHADPAALGRLSGELLAAFSHHVVAPAKAVIAAAGVDAGALKGLAEPLLGGAPRASHPAPSSQYVGGTMNCIAPAADSHFAVAFEVAGGSGDAKAVAASAVVAALLEAPARSPLPHTRREEGVVLQPLRYLYKSTGLLGVTARSGAGGMDKAVDGVSRRLEALAKDVSAAELQTAKAMALGAAEAELATRGGLALAIGRALLAHGKYERSEFAAKVTALTAADISGFVAKMLKGPSTFVSYGSLSALPRHDVFSKRLA